MHEATGEPIPFSHAATSVSSGSDDPLATLTIVFKLAESVQKRWRRLNGHELLAGITFTDGVKQHAA